MKKCVLALLALALCNLLYVGMAQAAPAGQENAWPSSPSKSAEGRTSIL